MLNFSVRNMGSFIKIHFKAKRYEINQNNKFGSYDPLYINNTLFSLKEGRDIEKYDIMGINYIVKQYFGSLVVQTRTWKNKAKQLC